MKGGSQVSPVVAGVIIAVVVVIAGFFIYKTVGPKGKVQMSPDQIKQMQGMMGTPQGGRGQHSTPPGVMPPK
jgi:cell division protein FtsN